jgi:Domain of unknown function (DUF4157)
MFASRASVRATNIPSRTPPQQSLVAGSRAGSHIVNGRSTSASDRSSQQSGVLRRLQRKLTVGQTNDSLEHEADRVADQVMGMPAGSPAISRSPPQISRMCATCEKEESLQRAPISAANGGREASSFVHEVVRSPGQPLDASSRAYFEPRFGRDFSRVRVHSDAFAQRAAGAVLARAFTVGSDIVFGSGRYEPTSNEGKRLLAHELTHVAQQTDSSRAPSRGEIVADGATPNVPGRSAVVTQAAPKGVQREPLSEEEIGKLPLDQVEARLLVNESEGSQWVLSESALDSLEAERGLLIKRRGQLSQAPGINAPATSAEQRWKEYRAAVEHTWEVEGKYPDYGSHARRMEAVGTWREYLKPEELRVFLDKDPDFKELYYMWRDYDNQWKAVYEKEKNDESLPFYQGTPTDPLVMGYAGGEYPITVRASELKAAREAAEIRNTLQKIEGVKEGGAFATLGRGVGGLVGWAFGKDVLKSSEIGATVGGGFDIALPIRAGSVAGQKAWAGEGTPGSYSPDVENKPLAVEYQQYLRKPTITSPGDPAKVAPPPTRDPIPTPDPVRSSDPAPPVAADTARDPWAGAIQRPVDVTKSGAFSATLQLVLDIAQAEQRHERLREKASQAENDYARSLRNTARAKERKSQQPTQQEKDLLATKKSLEKLRDDAETTLKQLQRSLDALQPKVGAQHGQAGLAQESKYVDELRAGGLPAEKTDPNMPVIDVAILKTPEIHSVKSLVPSKGLDAAVRLAERGLPRDLADSVSAKITEALVDRRSDKWNGLRNQWNTTKRKTYADHYGYDMPKNPDDINFVVAVRVVTANAPSNKAQQAVEAAVTTWLSKNERVPPRFTWRIVYVSN